MKKKMTKYGKGGSYKPVPTGNKGLGMLPTDVRNKMGYMMHGGEKLLTKMTYGGASMDMSDPLVETMRGKKGKEMKKTPMYKIGGWTHSKKK